jgi:hypothetical protein
VFAHTDRVATSCFAGVRLLNTCKPNSALPFRLVIENSLTDSAEAIGYIGCMFQNRRHSNISLCGLPEALQNYHRALRDINMD